MALLDDSFALITTQQRRISTLIPDVVVREVSRDELVITDHPVETGAAISDHAFMRPVEVEMVIGWSDSTAGQVGYIREVYEELLSLQKKREPFDISTGKRNYTSMLPGTISVQTDDRSENILMVTARFREIIIVSTQMTSPKSAQASPEKTGSTTDMGQKQLKSTSTSGFASPAQRA